MEKLASMFCRKEAVAKKSVSTSSNKLMQEEVVTNGKPSGPPKLKVIDMSRCDKKC
jgi:hypothetical protein